MSSSRSIYDRINPRLRGSQPPENTHSGDPENPQGKSGDQEPTPPGLGEVSDEEAKNNEDYDSSSLSLSLLPSSSSASSSPSTGDFVLGVSQKDALLFYYNDYRFLVSKVILSKDGKIATLYLRCGTKDPSVIRGSNVTNRGKCSATATVSLTIPQELVGIFQYKEHAGLLNILSFSGFTLGIRPRIN